MPSHRYVAVTGDATILDEQVPFIDGRAAEAGRARRLLHARDVARHGDRLYEHCARALDLAIARTGDNGLPLILGGDWNDGMNRVGEDGKGESVWLGWFLLKTLGDFAPHRARRRATPSAPRPGTSTRDRLKQALENAGLGRRVVSARQLRRRHAARLARLRRMPDRFDRPVLERALGRRRPGALDARRWTRRSSVLVDDELQIVKLFTPPFARDARRSRATSRAIRPACARMAASTPMPRPGS